MPKIDFKNEARGIPWGSHGLKNETKIDPVLFFKSSGFIRDQTEGTSKKLCICYQDPSPSVSIWKSVAWLLCHTLGPLINGSEGIGYKRW